MSGIARIRLRIKQLNPVPLLCFPGSAPRSVSRPSRQASACSTYPSQYPADGQLG